MLPSLLPNYSHFSSFAAGLFTAVISIGIGRIMGLRRAEIALVGGWGVAAIATVFFGTLTNLSLSIIMAALGVAGCCGVLVEAIRIPRGRGRLEYRQLLQVFILGIPLLFFLEGMNSVGWDDFSHWLPNLTYLCQHGHFPSLAMPAASHHAAYPYASAIIGYSVFLMTGQIPENVAILWNAILILAAAASTSKVLHANFLSAAPGAPEEKLFSWAISALSLCLVGLLCPSFVSKIVFCNMTDSGTGALLVVLTAICYDWFHSSGENKVSLAFAFSLCASAFVDLRQTNFVLLMLLAAGVGFSAFWNRRVRQPPSLMVCLIALGPPVFIWFLWNRYATLEIPGGAFGLLPIRQWHWHELPSTIESMFKVMFEKFLFFAVELYVVLRTFWVFLKRKPILPEVCSVLIVTSVLIAGNTGFLFFTYLAGNFASIEAATAASFWRYAGQTGPVMMLAVLSSLPQLSFLNRPWRLQLLIAFALIYPIISVRFYRDDLRTSVPILRAIAAQADKIIPAGQPVALVDLSGNGFATLIMQYQFQQDSNVLGMPPRKTIIVASAFGIAGQSLTKLQLEKQPYAVLADGSPDMARAFNYPVAYGCSYLFKSINNNSAPIQDWSLGRFPLENHGYSKSTGPSEDCITKN
jgi:hypothetical protein